MIALSTSWNGSRHTDGVIMANQIYKLGFEHLALAAEFPISAISGLRNSMVRRGMSVVSVQAFAPESPIPGGAVLDSSALLGEGDDRQQALHRLRRTIEFASELKAQAVILRMGKLPLNAPTAKLLRLVRGGGQFRRKYTMTKVGAVKMREELVGGYLDRARKSLDEILNYAADFPIRIALESGDQFEGIPSEREVGILMKEYEGSALGYWHNFAHVQSKENLGFIDHAECLEDLAPHLVGCYVSDHIWPDPGGLVPFRGELDFETLLQHVPLEVPLVWNLDERQKTPEIQRGMVEWNKRFPERAFPGIAAESESSLAEEGAEDSDS